MSFSYNPALPADLDVIRFTLGDTETTEPLLQDAEITAVLAQTSGAVNLAAAICAESIGRRFLREASTRVGPVSFDLSKRAEMWMKEALRLRSLGNIAMPVAGGIVDAVTGELKPPLFTRLMDDNPDSGRPGLSSAG